MVGDSSVVHVGSFHSRPGDPGFSLRWHTYFSFIFLENIFYKAMKTKTKLKKHVQVYKKVFIVFLFSKQKKKTPIYGPMVLESSIVYVFQSIKIKKKKERERNKSCQNENALILFGYKIFRHT